MSKGASYRGENGVPSFPVDDPYADLTQEERRKLISDFSRAAKDIKVGGETLLGDEDEAGGVLRDEWFETSRRAPRRPGWLTRLRIDAYAYAHGFGVTGLAQLVSSVFSFLWPRHDTIRKSFAVELVYDAPGSEKPAQLSLAHTLLELRRNADFLVNSDYFLRRTRDPRKEFRRSVRSDLANWEPFGRDLLETFTAMDEAGMESLRGVRRDLDAARSVDVYELPAVVRAVSRTCVRIEASSAEVKAAVLGVAEIVRSTYTREYGISGTEDLNARVVQAANSFLALYARLKWFARQFFPVLLKLLNTFVEEERAREVRRQILAYLGLTKEDLLRPVYGLPPDVTQATEAPPRAEPQYRTDIQDYVGILRMLGQVFPGSGVERIPDGDFSCLIWIAEKYFGQPSANPSQAGRRPGYVDLIRKLSRTDPLAPVVLLHELVAQMLDSVDLDAISRLADPVYENFADVRDRLVELRDQWRAVREELLRRYLEEVAYYERETSGAGEGSDNLMVATMRKRVSEAVNQIRNHIIYDFGHTERAMDREQYFRARPLYNVCNEMYEQLAKIHPDREGLEKGSPVLVQRLAGTDFLRFQPSRLMKQLEAYVTALVRDRPLLKNREADSRRVFLDFLVGCVDLLNYLLNDGSSVLRRGDGDVSFAGGDEVSIREEAAGSPSRLRADLATDSGALDRLTGLMSKNEYLRVAPETFRAAHLGGEALSLAMIDLDNFKRINDSQGHQYGDRFLREICALVKRSLRPGDVAARFGGEEIVVLVRGDVNEAFGLAERMRRQCRSYVASRHGKAMEAAAAGGTQPVGTLSIGVAQGLGKAPGAPLEQSCATDEQLLARADSMLYLAKNQGRDRVVGMVDELEMPMVFGEYAELHRVRTANPGASPDEILDHFAETGVRLTFDGYEYQQYVRMQKLESA